MKALLIAPFPPPATGHSIAAQVLLDAVRERHQAAVVDLSKQGFTHGVDSARRIAEVAGILGAVRRKRRGADVLYLTIAESVAGNLKDLLIYALCFRQLPRMVVHLHGGSIRKLLFDRYPALARVNGFFLRRVGAVVILGETHREIFAGLVDPGRVRIVANSADNALFRTEAEIRARFADRGPMRVTFLSNLIHGKGYNELLDAYEGLSGEDRGRVVLEFAGGFETDAERDRFLGRVGSRAGVTYHGVVGGADKAALLGRTHVLCLPTSLFEGQPVSILEAYAAGCVVLATDTGGIRDVFRDGQNGIVIESPAPVAIGAAIGRALAQRDSLVETAVANMKAARERYTPGAYSSALIAVLEDVAGAGRRPNHS